MPHVKGNKFKPKLPEDVQTIPEEGKNTVRKKDKKPKKDEIKNKKLAAQQEEKKRSLATIISPPPKKAKQTTSAPQSPAPSNWAVLKASIDASKGNRKPKKDTDKNAAITTTTSPPSHSQILHPTTKLTKVIALDCEMVGIGRDGLRSAVARVSIVNSTGTVIFDSFVAPPEKVTDYRTQFSGVRPHQLKDAPSLNAIQPNIAALLRGRIVVGHALHNDLEVLGIRHPEKDIRDSARYPPFSKTLPGGRVRPRALRHLVEEHLGMSIQSGEHSSIEDARAALSLYQRHKAEWEHWISKGGKMVPLKVLKSRGGGKKKVDIGEKIKKLNSQNLLDVAQNDYMADL